jgi:hypothetical protein
VRHRNDTERPLTVAADPPFLVEPGEETDHPEHVAGLTCLDEPCPPAVEPVAATEVPAESAEPAQPARSARRRGGDTAEEA